MEGPQQGPQTGPRGDRTSTASEISREIVRLHARLFGRGPTRAKTFLYDDFALCILEDVLTRAEKTLVTAGNTEQVHATRMAFQEAVRPEFVALAEEATGRTVRAFVSQIHIDPELAFELFLFEPEGQTSPDPVPPEAEAEE
jgi:uncharacterized protein YbcI